MKVISKIATAPLRATSLQTGTLIAIGMLILFVGFAAGWIAAVETWKHLYFPVV